MGRTWGRKKNALQIVLERVFRYNDGYVGEKNYERCIRAAIDPFDRDKNEFVLVALWLALVGFGESLYGSFGLVAFGTLPGISG